MNDIIVTRQFGDKTPIGVKLDSKSVIQKKLDRRHLHHPGSGGFWDVKDYGDYVISTIEGKVFSQVTTTSRALPIQSREIGRFHYQESASDVIYVDTFADNVDASDSKTTLREAIAKANASATPQKIF